MFNQSILKTESTYLRSIRASITGLWRSQISSSDFQSSMLSAITRAYNQAAIEGAKQCGISVDEMTDEELKKVGELIENEKGYIDGLMNDIVENSQENGGKLADLINRASMWSTKYNQVKALIQMIACKNSKMKWIYGDARHCGDCDNLNGRVYRASTWQASGIYPQSAALSCKGFRCKCRMEITNERVTPGKVPGMKGSKSKRRK